VWGTGLSRNPGVDDRRHRYIDPGDFTMSIARNMIRRSHISDFHKAATSMGSWVSRLFELLLRMINQ